jgi:hypothetical protein
VTHDTPPAEVIRLWPDGPPTTLEGVGPEVEVQAPVGVAGHATILRNVSEPTLSVYRPTNGKPNGVGVIVCPGGGWRLLAWEHEGTDVVRWLTAHGYTAFLLKYRVRATPAAQADYDAEMLELYTQIDLTRRGRTAFRAMGEAVPYEMFGAARDAAADDGRRAIEIVRAHLSPRPARLRHGQAGRPLRQMDRPLPRLAHRPGIWLRARIPVHC